MYIKYNIIRGIVGIITREAISMNRLKFDRNERIYYKRIKYARKGNGKSESRVA